MNSQFKVGFRHRRNCRSERGAILAMVMVYLLILSIIGLTALHLAGLFRLNTQDEIHVIQNKYAGESVLNLALWKLNHIPNCDDITNWATFQEGGVSSVYEKDLLKLTVISNQWGSSDTTWARLSVDHPFNHIIAYEDADISKPTFNYVKGYGPKQFDCFPTLDVDYYRSIADIIYPPNTTTTYGGGIIEGIHFVEETATLELQGVTLESGAIVVLGKLRIHPGNTTTLKAATAFGGGYIPVLIVAPTGNVSPAAGGKGKGAVKVNVNGAAYIEGDMDFLAVQSNFTGPVVIRSANLPPNVTFDDKGSENYYIWPPGFGNIGDYNWPKRILAGQWEFSL